MGSFTKNPWLAKCVLGLFLLGQVPVRAEELEAETPEQSPFIREDDSSEHSLLVNLFNSIRNKDGDTAYAKWAAGGAALIYVAGRVILTARAHKIRNLSLRQLVAYEDQFPGGLRNDPRFKEPLTRLAEAETRLSDSLGEISDGRLRRQVRESFGAEVCSNFLQGLSKKREWGKRVWERTAQRLAGVKPTESGYPGTRADTLETETDDTLLRNMEADTAEIAAAYDQWRTSMLDMQSMVKARTGIEFKTIPPTEQLVRTSQWAGGKDISNHRAIRDAIRRVEASVAQYEAVLAKDAGRGVRLTRPQLDEFRANNIRNGQPPLKGLDRDDDQLTRFMGFPRTLIARALSPKALLKAKFEIASAIGIIIVVGAMNAGHNEDKLAADLEWNEMFEERQNVARRPFESEGHLERAAILSLVTIWRAALANKKITLPEDSFPFLALDDKGATEMDMSAAALDAVRARHEQAKELAATFKITESEAIWLKLLADAERGGKTPAESPEIEKAQMQQLLDTQTDLIQSLAFDTTHFYSVGGPAFEALESAVAAKATQESKSPTSTTP